MGLEILPFLLEVPETVPQLANWQAEHGVLTAEEIARAERELGLAANDTAA